MGSETCAKNSQFFAQLTWQPARNSMSSSSSALQSRSPQSSCRWLSHGKTLQRYLWVQSSLILAIFPLKKTSASCPDMEHLETSLGGIDLRPNQSTGFVDPVHEVHHRTPPSNIELLPAEIRLQILYIAGFGEVHGLVRASPIFYQQYIKIRRKLLKHHAELNFGTVILEAQASLQSSRVARSNMHFEFSGYLHNYQQRRMGLCQSPLESILHQYQDKELFGLLTFHAKVIEPLILKFFEWLSIHEDAPFGNLRLGHPVSISERTRALRGFYRFQICNNLFGMARRFLLAYAETYRADDVLNAFFILFQPWEIEELNTIFEFAWDQYDKVADEVGPSIDHERQFTAEYDDDDISSVIFIGSKGSPTRVKSIGWALTRGLRPLQRILAASHEFERRAHFNTATQSSCELWRQAGVFGRKNQDEVRRLHWAERTTKMREQEPMEFKGDVEGDVGPTSPPWAWTFVWDGRYSDLFGDYIPSYFRRLGYVIWDAGRFEQREIREELRKRWLERCGSQDARRLANLDGLIV